MLYSYFLFFLVIMLGTFLLISFAEVLIAKFKQLINYFLVYFQTYFRFIKRSCFRLKCVFYICSNCFQTRFARLNFRISKEIRIKFLLLKNVKMKALNFIYLVCLKYLYKFFQWNNKYEEMIKRSLREIAVIFKLFWMKLWTLSYRTRIIFRSRVFIKLYKFFNVTNFSLHKFFFQSLNEK